MRLTLGVLALDGRPINGFILEGDGKSRQRSAATALQQGFK